MSIITQIVTVEFVRRPVEESRGSSRGQVNAF